MERRYVAAARLLHWLIGLCVLGLVLAGLVLRFDLAPKPVLHVVAFLHISVGLTVLALMVLRLVVRLGNPPPALPVAIPLQERRLSLAAHWAFYGLLFAMPVFGIVFVQAHGTPVSWFGVLTLKQVVATSKPVHARFAFLHFWGGMALIALILVHVGAVIRHHRRGVPLLRRMWG